MSVLFVVYCVIVTRSGYTEQHLYVLYKFGSYHKPENISGLKEWDFVSFLHLVV